VSSPHEPPGSSSLIHTGATSMPSLAKLQRHAADRGWYLLVDPAGRYPAQARSERTVDFGPAIRSLIFLTFIIGFGLWAAHNRLSTPEALLFFLLGGCAGVVVGGALSALVTRLPVTWRRADERPRLRVTPADERAWRLCETVAGLAATNSWGDQTIDPRRRAPAILWEAVGRSLAIERQYLDAQRALDHESLHDLGRETLARIERERESLDAVELNLRTVLTTAQDIDRQRERRAREREKRAEERELRTRMAGSLGSAVEPTESDQHADAAAGMAAEAKAIAELLAASDMLLNDLE
jgi:hypothetical protein